MKKLLCALGFLAFFSAFNFVSFNSSFAREDYVQAPGNVRPLCAKQFVAVRNVADMSTVSMCPVLKSALAAANVEKSSSPFAGGKLSYGKFVASDSGKSVIRYSYIAIKLVIKLLISLIFLMVAYRVMFIWKIDIKWESEGVENKETKKTNQIMGVRPMGLMLLVLLFFNVVFDRAVSYVPGLNTNMSISAALNSQSLDSNSVPATLSGATAAAGNFVLKNVSYEAIVKQPVVQKAVNLYVLALKSVMKLAMFVLLIVGAYRFYCLWRIDIDWIWIRNIGLAIIILTFSYLAVKVYVFEDVKFMNKSEATIDVGRTPIANVSVSPDGLPSSNNFVDCRNPNIVYEMCSADKPLAMEFPKKYVISLKGDSLIAVAPIQISNVLVKVEEPNLPVKSDSDTLF